MEGPERVTIEKLDFGFGDAINYTKRDNRDFFSQAFIKDEAFRHLLSRDAYYLIGEKGTGKTAHAVFLGNVTQRLQGQARDSVCQLRVIADKDYHEIERQRQHYRLDEDDFERGLNVVLHHLVLETILDKSDQLLAFPLRSMHAANIEACLRRATNVTNSPDVTRSIKFVESLLHPHGNHDQRVTTNSVQEEELSPLIQFRQRLDGVEQSFLSTINSLKLQSDLVCFVDGLDVRPRGLDYDKYLALVAALANAVWKMNAFQYPQVRDSVGRLRVVLLIRPDIFHAIGMQNTNNKIRDNSVVLDYRTTYESFHHSPIFQIAAQLLRVSQEYPTKSLDAKDATPLQLWESYFPFRLPTNNDLPKQTEGDDPFIHLLRYSLYRPRDIVTYLSLMQTEKVSKNQGDERSFRYEDLVEREVVRKYSDYLLGEIKDHLSFYYTNGDYETLVAFFDYLDRTQDFDYTKFGAAYRKHVSHLRRSGHSIPLFMQTADTLLQFLYDLNMICSIQTNPGHKPLMKWCFRERSTSNLAPRIKLGVSYRVHRGFHRALHLDTRS